MTRCWGADGPPRPHPPRPDPARPNRSTRANTAGVAAVFVAALAGCAQPERDHAALGPPCDEAAPKPAIGGASTLHLFRGAGVQSDEVLALAHAVTSYFADFELELAISAGVTALPYEAMLTAPKDQAPLRSAHADPERLLHRLREFVREHAADDDGSIRIVVLQAIAPPNSPVTRATGGLRGLALSPAISSAGLHFDLRSVLGASHAPVVLLAPRGDSVADARVLAHEIGHALGLDHRHHPHNLMTQHDHGCAPVIDAEQAATMRQALTRRESSPLPLRPAGPRGIRLPRGCARRRVGRPPHCPRAPQ